MGNAIEESLTLANKRDKKDKILAANFNFGTQRDICLICLYFVISYLVKFRKRLTLKKHERTYKHVQVNKKTRRSATYDVVIPVNSQSQSCNCCCRRRRGGLASRPVS